MAKLIIKNAETTYDKLSEASGVPRMAIIRNAKVLFDMLEDIGMNSNGKI